MTYVELLNRNNVLLKKYNTSKLMKLLDSEVMDDENCRQTILDCIQVFSNYFQKIMMLRLTFTDSLEFMELAQEHLDEEYGHNKILLNERKNKKLKWDPILDSCSAWFSWKMLSLDNVEKVFLVHMVLESSADIFFKKAAVIMLKHNTTSYFNIHSEHDERHANMGLNFLEGLRQDEYEKLFTLQTQAWDVLLCLCDRISDVVSDFSCQ